MIFEMAWGAIGISNEIVRRWTIAVTTISAEEVAVLADLAFKPHHIAFPTENIHYRTG